MTSSASSASSGSSGRETLSKVQRLTAALCHLQLATLSCSTCKYFCTFQQLQIWLHFPTIPNILKNFPRLANILDAFKNLWICFTYLLDLQAQSSTTLNFFAYYPWDLELDSWIGRTLDCLNRAGVWWRINPVSVFVVYQYCICPPLAPIWTHLMGCGPHYKMLRL